MAVALDRAVVNLKQVKNRLGHIKRFCEGPSADAATCIARVDLAKDLHGEANKIWSSAFIDEEDPLLSELELLLTEIDDMFLEVSTYAIKSSGSTGSTRDRSLEPPLASPTMPNNSRMPKIDIPKFNGNRTEWPRFYDLFRTMVHENSSLSNIERFQYLRMYLEADALAVVNGLKFVADNYQIAYELLVDRYEDKRYLATQYWQAIWNAPKVDDNSPRSLIALFGRINENKAALDQYTEIDKWDFNLFNILLQKLDQDTRQRFEIEYSHVALPSFEQLNSFVAKQCKALEKADFISDKTKRYAATQKAKFDKTVCVASAPCCTLCKASHMITRCAEFLSKSVKDRFNFARSRKLCLNCLQASHFLKDCPSKLVCRQCKSKHNTLLHFEQNASPTASVDTSANSTTNTTLTTLLMSQNLVLLATIQLRVKDRFGNLHKIRALLDTGSQANFMTSRCRKRLHLPATGSSLVVNGFGQRPSAVSEVASCTLHSRFNESTEIVVECFIVPQICGKMPTVELPRHSWAHLRGSNFADPDFHKPNNVDMLLGADIFANIMLGGKLVGKPGEPAAFETHLGWIVTGQVSNTPSSSLTSAHISVDAATNLDCTLRAFWEVETVPEENIHTMSKEELQCEQVFVDTHVRNSDGRFEVQLPFKGPEPIFVNSRALALKRFLLLERRLCKQPELYTAYKEFMDDYLRSGHMTRVPTPSQTVVESKMYYIPHHCVLRPESESTKLRVVFDASAKTLGGDSLNDSLLIGPKLQKDIVSMLCHFRLHNVVLVADVKQMYRQILVDCSHRDYQRILWGFSSNEPISDFRLNTVTYGVSSAPFLALRTMLELAKVGKQTFPAAAAALSEDTYVDDIVTGAASIEDAQILVSQLVDLLKSAGLELRKWASNCSQSLSRLPPEHCRQQCQKSFDQGTDCPIKILGLNWTPSGDVFHYAVQPVNRACTKRTILSELARIFDPLGFLAPLTLVAKVMIQQLWTLGVQWDDEPPAHVKDKWKRYIDELPSLVSLTIPRQIVVGDCNCIQLHAFCDASETGYGAVVYFRFVSNGEIKIFLVCGKSKVAPLKRISVPRLELCAAVLLTTLVRFVVNTFEGKLAIEHKFAWSDSKVALSWIKSAPHRWQTFVANRVTQIQEIISPDSWFYVKSKENPADCASRGLLPEDLINEPLWWSGPDWLSQDQKSWQMEPNNFQCAQANLEQRREVLLTSLSESDIVNSLLYRYSSLPKIQRIIAYMRRFVHNSRHPTDQIHGDFGEQELQNSLESLVQIAQRQCFADVIHRLKHNQSVPLSIRRLSPFLDSAGLLRVGGRLSRSGLPFHQKHPLLLPRKHRLSDLIVDYFHQKYLHAGLQTLHFLILQQFWLLSPRRAIRGRISKCIRCFRARPVAIVPPMGDLPLPRISQLKPFSHAGVDFAGPISITLSKRRGVKAQKAYICIFVCFAVKAVHLELVSDLSSDAFLAAFRRFVSRRGRCSDLYSDCGTNFVGANRTLVNYCRLAAENLAINWHFNPPASPNFGGIWEAGVKSVKTHLVRVIGSQILSYEEYYTLLVQIEAILNSRPLFAPSSDPNDLDVLTPGHFLTLEPLSAPPDENLGSLKIGRLSRWQFVQRCQQEFWRRWHNEYLSTLQQRPKRRGNTETTINIHDLVIIKGDNIPPLQWPLGRIVALHPGRDGINRVASVKTAKGVMQRPLSKLCKMPCCDE